MSLFFCPDSVSTHRIKKSSAVTSKMYILLSSFRTRFASDVRLFQALNNDEMNLCK